MGKYEPLGNFLRNQRTKEVPLTFRDIERITGVKLPPKAQHQRAWWSNNPSNNVMTKVWLEAGYESARVDIDACKLVFRRKERPRADTTVATPTRPPQQKGGRHPLFGALKGMIIIPDDVDLTEPADPEWAKLLDEKYGPERR
jgi:hypothetical protein